MFSCWALLDNGIAGAVALFAVFFFRGGFSYYLVLLAEGLLSGPNSQKWRRFAGMVNDLVEALVGFLIEEAL